MLARHTETGFVGGIKRGGVGWWGIYQTTIPFLKTYVRVNRSDV